MKSGVILLALCGGAPARDSSGPPPRRDEFRLTFDFRGVPVETVLQHVADATGWIFVLERPIRGTLDAVADGKVPVTKCIDFLNSVLRRRGALILNPHSPGGPKPGRVLRIVDGDRAER